MGARKKKGAVGLLSTILGPAHIGPFYNLVRILQSSSRVIVIEVAMNDLRINPELRVEETYRIVHGHSDSPLATIVNYVWTQMRISLRIASMARRVDSWYFFLAHNMILPLLAARLTGRRVFLIMGGLYRFDVRYKHGRLDHLIAPLETLGLLLSSGIIIYSPSLVRKWGLERFECKIQIAYQHLLDMQEFRIITPISERPLAVGHIGRLSGEKGTMNFTHSIPIARSFLSELNFVIGGDGPLASEVRDFVKEKGLGNVELLGWISHEDLPSVLNRLKLVVLPSYTEGLPNIMIEAMACGTPILATQVGAIPDLIEDGLTGFLMEDNSAESVARNIVRSLNHTNLEEVSRRGRELTESKFKYEYVVNMWERVLENNK